VLKPKLVSFKICPFVQRSVILLNEKNIEYDITFINPSEPPDWFIPLSPTGNVPIILVGDTVIFESMVILEYLDEAYPPSLHAENPLDKAKNRAWMDYTSSLFSRFASAMMAKTESEFKAAIVSMKSTLNRLEHAKSPSPWFDGVAFSMVDIAIAPFFIRAEIFKNQFDIDFLNSHPQLDAWSNDVLKRTSVQASKVEGFAEMLTMRMTKNKSHVLAVD